MTGDPKEVCVLCGATRWEHSDEQWAYCHLSEVDCKRVRDADEDVSLIDAVLAGVDTVQ